MFSSNVISKRRSISDAFCKLCKKFLTGNGSAATPYRCDCGIYEYQYSRYTYVLKKSEEAQ